MKPLWIATLIIGLGTLPVLAAGTGGSNDAPLSIANAPVQQKVRLACVFDRECYEDEACANAAFEATLTGEAGGLTSDAMVANILLQSMAGDVDLLGYTDGAQFSLSGGTASARNLITLAASGDARYSVHYMDGPMVISYLGRCEPEAAQ